MGSKIEINPTESGPTQVLIRDGRKIRALFYAPNAGDAVDAIRLQNELALQFIIAKAEDEEPGSGSS